MSTPLRRSEQDRSTNALDGSVETRLLPTLKLVLGQLPASWLTCPEIRTPTRLDPVCCGWLPQPKIPRFTISETLTSHGAKKIIRSRMFIFSVEAAGK